MLVRFEVFTVVTMKNGVFWDVTPCGSSSSSETLVLTRATRRNLPEDTILQGDAISSVIFYFALKYDIWKLQENQL
jgi:hypothetical protein